MKPGKIIIKLIVGIILGIIIGTYAGEWVGTKWLMYVGVFGKTIL